MRLATEGAKTVIAAATPEVLVAAAHRCKAVRIFAPSDVSGAATNTKTAFVGVHATAPKLPIAPSNFEGEWLYVDDAAKVYVQAGANGEGVAYQIYH